MNAAGIFSATGGRKSMAAALMVMLFAIAPAFAINFPALTGRVVDQANIIQPDTRVALEQKLADLEDKSGIQLVVATVMSLEGQEIEPYANELFRKWALGEKKKNNGVLLVVAPNERRVRIEVGYGLEGTLTDALSKVIISNAMTPRFKAGNFSEGISRGVDDIITVLTTDASEWQKRPSLRLDYQQPVDTANWILLAALFGFFILLIVSPTFRWLFFNVVLNVLASSGSSRGGYSGGSYSGGGYSGGGGFSGGGGSSGGGGASGSW
ncbi:MAG: YgcG family protein [Pseudolabrys sp.]